MTTVMRAALLAALSTVCSAALVSYPASDARFFTWSGRTVASPSGGVTFDLEGTTLDFAVANATFVGLTVVDRTPGGMRLGVYLDTVGEFGGSAADPNPAGADIPGARVSTLLTSPQQALYTLASGAQIARLSRALHVRVANLAEYSMTGSAAGGANVTVAAVVTDGVLQAAPAARPRRFLVLGDSLSSGVGSGFTIPPDGAPCGAGVALDDWSTTWNALLCANFSAACEVVAQSGVTLVADAAYNLPMSIPYALGAMGYAAWPAAERVLWTPRPVDAIFVELGENDAHAFNVTSPSGAARLAAAYVALARSLAAAYGAATPLFFVLANHEAGQSVAMALAVAELPHAALLNGTTPTLDPRSKEWIGNGCAGHPSAAQNVLAFARMQPVVAAALARR